MGGINAEYMGTAALNFIPSTDNQKKEKLQTLGWWTPAVGSLKSHRKSFSLLKSHSLWPARLQ